MAAFFNPFDHRQPPLATGFLPCGNKARRTPLASQKRKRLELAHLGETAAFARTEVPVMKVTHLPSSPSICDDAAIWSFDLNS